MAALTKLTTNINLEMSGDTKRYLVSAKQGDKATRFIVAFLDASVASFVFLTACEVSCCLCCSCWMRVFSFSCRLFSAVTLACSAFTLAFSAVTLADSAFLTAASVSSIFLMCPAIRFSRSVNSFADKIAFSFLCDGSISIVNDADVITCESSLVRISMSQGYSTTVNHTQSRRVREQSSTLQNRTENMYITHVHIPVRM